MATLRKISSIGILLGTIPVLIISCTNSDNDGIPVQDKSAKNKAEKNKTLASKFGEAIPLDSTTSVMYPLTLSTSGKDDEGLKSYSSRESEGPYWNIAFHDTKTGVSNLLNFPTPIRINSFQKLKDMIIYNVTVNDYNLDGQLDHKDPSYLFTSTLSGKQFKQITPKNMDVNNFKTGSTLTILIQATTDSNGDQKFGEEDDVIPLIFDIQKGDVAKEVFNPAFKAGIAEAFNKLYK
ncbi:MAG TPA: hypothetical protein VK541_22920 [Pedobacter sp.]|uniref:hypothetical protein n=1 Tax=Pedobacter sp. TaxID=1411316 RepID=UPI002B8378BE|nr:hypothetical protein [Pedobacter sp.]HMI05360.1 hypothetical protein [Pedobacter sp.]